MTKPKIYKCSCGRRMSRWAIQCGACHKTSMEKATKEAQEIVATNKCPLCGSKLVKNNALPGWYQCVQYGRWKETVGDLNKPNCGFQCFTEYSKV